MQDETYASTQLAGVSLLLIYAHDLDTTLQYLMEDMVAGPYQAHWHAMSYVDIIYCTSPSILRIGMISSWQCVSPGRAGPLLKNVFVNVTLGSVLPLTLSPVAMALRATAAATHLT